MSLASVFPDLSKIILNKAKEAIPIFIAGLRDLQKNELTCYITTSGDKQNLVEFASTADYKLTEEDKELLTDNIKMFWALVCYLEARGLEEGKGARWSNQFMKFEFAYITHSKGKSLYKFYVWISK